MGVEGSLAKSGNSWVTESAAVAVEVSLLKLKTTTIVPFGNFLTREEKREKTRHNIAQPKRCHFAILFHRQSKNVA